MIIKWFHVDVARLVELTTQSKPEMKKVRCRPWTGPNRDFPSKRAAQKR